MVGEIPVITGEPTMAGVGVGLGLDDPLLPPELAGAAAPPPPPPAPPPPPSQAAKIAATVAKSVKIEIDSVLKNLVFIFLTPFVNLFGSIYL